MLLVLVTKSNRDSCKVCAEADGRKVLESLMAKVVPFQTGNNEGAGSKFSAICQREDGAFDDDLSPPLTSALPCVSYLSQVRAQGSESWGGKGEAL